jgi:serine/threonine protein kinase
MNNNEKNNINFYIDKSKAIGEGSNGYVYSCYKINDHKEYIAKIVFKGIEEASKEFNNILDFNNKNLVKFYDFEECENGKTFLIFEFCNGLDLELNIINYIKKYNEGFSQKICQKILVDVVNGLACLHRNDIKHNDIKLTNILINYNDKESYKKLDILNSTVKICDFGISSFVFDNTHKESGSISYLDPQTLGLDKRIKNNSIRLERDIWALGIVAFQLIFLKHPFYDEYNFEELKKNIQNGLIKIEITENFQKSKEELCFIDACLKYDCKDRYTIDYLQYCPYLTKNVEQFHIINNQNFKEVLPKEMIYDNKFIIIDIKKKERLFKLLDIYTF